MAALMRRRKTPASTLGMRLRQYAAGYAAAGQRERAEGLLQAADMLDAELGGENVSPGALEALHDAVEAVRLATEKLVRATALAKRTSKPPPTPVLRVTEAPPTPKLAPAKTAARGELGAGAHAVLIALAQYPAGLERSQLSVITGYARSSRDSHIHDLRERGFAEARAAKLVATRAGIDALGSAWDQRPRETYDLRAWWYARLPEGERRVLQYVIDRGTTTREQVGAAIGYARSSRDACLHRLRARELIVIGPGGEIRAAQQLRSGFQVNP